MPLSFQGAYPLPGIGATLQTTENIVWWGLNEHQKVMSAILDGSARDVGNATATSVLRAGLLLGKITATGKLMQWNPEAVDGTERIYGVLLYDQRMSDMGADTDRWFGYVLVGGNLKATALIVPTTIAAGVVTANGTLNGSTYELLARALLTSTGRFMLDDEPQGNLYGGWQRVEIVVAARTVVEADNGTLFVNTTGANTYVLPPPRPGFSIGVITGSAHAVTLTPASGTMVIAGNATAATVTTAGTIGIFTHILGIIGPTTGAAQYLSLPSAGSITVSTGGALEAVTAAGTARTNAQAIAATTAIAAITCDSIAKGVVLPTSLYVNQRITLIGGAASCHVYVLSSGTINGVAGATGIVIGAGQQIDVVCRDITTDTQLWTAVPWVKGLHQAVTAQTGGGTTGLISAGTTTVTVTCDAVTKAVTLPTARFVGERVVLTGGAFSCIVLIGASGTIDGIAGATGAILPAGTIYAAVCTSIAAANVWILEKNPVAQTISAGVLTGSTTITQAAALAGTGTTVPACNVPASCTLARVTPTAAASIALPVPLYLGQRITISNTANYALNVYTADASIIRGGAPHATTKGAVILAYGCAIFEATSLGVTDADTSWTAVAATSVMADSAG